MPVTSVIEIPDRAPGGHGWTVENDEIMYLWYDGSWLPHVLANDESLLDIEETDDDDEQDDDEPNMCV